MTAERAPIITVTLNPALDKALDVPGFHVGAHARARVRSLLPAGKGVNVARGLARLGTPAVACGLVGRDEHAAFATSLQAEGVTADLCIVAGRTRTNTTILDPDSRTTTHLREEGFQVGEGDLAALTDLLRARLAAAPGSTVAFAGSLPPGLGPEEFARLVVACAEAAGHVVVDTNGPALAASVATGVVAVLKPNLLELGECVGRSVPRSSAVGAARSLLDRVGTVLLTLGPEGALCVTSEGAIGRRCPVPRALVANTVGCGDAFLAGWLQGTASGASPADALCWGVAAGAASAMSDSTVGYSLYDVRGLLARCEPFEP